MTESNIKLDLNSQPIDKNDIKNIVVFLGFILFTILIFMLASKSGWISHLQDQSSIQTTINELGVYGPLIIILLISAAIIISPLPSAPIALVSGVLYGHTLGTIYVVIGSTLGALSAFIISRKLGHNFFSKKFNSKITVKIVNSQNLLMLFVFATRFAPFISFDVISYAAGLTNLTILRFFIATLLGIIPISFTLAHIGSELPSGEFESIGIALVILGLFSTTPFIIKKLTNKHD